MQGIMDVGQEGITTPKTPTMTREEFINDYKASEGKEPGEIELQNAQGTYWE